MFQKYHSENTILIWLYKFRRCFLNLVNTANNEPNEKIVTKFNSWLLFDIMCNFKSLHNSDKKSINFKQSLQYRSVSMFHLVSASLTIKKSWNSGSCTCRNCDYTWLQTTMWFMTTKAYYCGSSQVMDIIYTTLSSNGTCSC